MVRRSDWIFETSLRRFKNIVYLVSLGWRYPGPGAGVSQRSLLGHSGWGNRTGDFYYDLHFLNLLYTPAFLPNIVTLFISYSYVRIFPFIIFSLDDTWMQDTAYWCPFSLSKQSPVFFWCSGLTLLPRCEQCCLAKHWLFVQLTILICNLLHLNDLKVFSRIHQSVK